MVQKIMILDSTEMLLLHYKCTTVFVIFFVIEDRSAMLAVRHGVGIFAVRSVVLSSESQTL